MLERKEIKDRDQKCATCGSALTELERMEIGEKCVFCGEIVFEVPIKCKTRLVEHLMGIYLNRKIYSLKLKLKLKYGAEDRFVYLGVLGVLGLPEFMGLESLDKKREIVKGLKNALNKKEGDYA